MRHEDSTAVNPLVRLTSFTCETGSDRIENFCTELLAWSLIQSKTFRSSLLKALGLPADANGFECHTQQYYENGKLGKEKDEGFFDLLILTREPACCCVVEVKVWFSLDDSQLERYRSEINRRPEYSGARRVVATITPFMAKSQVADQHFMWGQIEGWLRDAVRVDGLAILEYFADFLQFRGLGAIKMNPLSNDLLSNWQAFAAAQQEWCHLLKRLQTDPQLEAVFGSRLKEPKLDYDPKTGRSWIGFYSTSASPGIYVGIGFRADKLPALWLEFETPAKSAGKLLNPGSLSPELKQCWENAKEYSSISDPWANLGNSANDTVISVFVQPLTPKFDGNAEGIQQWFHNVVLSITQRI